MALITENPGGLPPEENTLRDIPDDLLGPHPASIRLGNKDLLTMDRPPLPGETIKVELTLYHKRGGYELVGAAPNKEMAYHCGMVLVNAHVTVDPYTATANADDPAMIDEHGNIPDDEPEDDGGHNDHVHVETEPDDDGLNEFDPAFSHNAQ